MKTIDRYLLREISIPFLVGMGLFFVVIAFGQVLKVSDSVTGIGISGVEILEALLYSLPPLVGILIPVSMLFATLLAVGRLANDREIIGLCAGGVSPYRLLRVPVAFSVVLAALAMYATMVGEPWGVKGLRDLMSRSAQRTLAQGVRVGEFNEWISGVVLLARGKKTDGSLENILFADRRNPNTPVVISAKAGRVQMGHQSSDLIFQLEDGVILLETGRKDSSRVIDFERMFYRLDVNHLVGNKARTLMKVQEKSVSELIEGIQNLPDKSARALYTVILNRKAAIPLATIIFALLAVPMGCNRGGAARTRGFLISTILVGAYYYIGRAVELQARFSDFPPVLAAWVPNLLACIGVVFLLKRFKRSAI